MRRKIIIFIVFLIIVISLFYIFKVRLEKLEKAKKFECPPGARIECKRPDGKIGYRICENGHWSKECHWLPECSVGQRKECFTKEGKKDLEFVKMIIGRKNVI